MNRCIHCWRCRRFYQEFAGYRDLGALQIGSRTYFGRFQPGRVESPFSGNLIDICPTGVFTDKPSRFKGRRWDWQRSPSLCIHCSLGCTTVASIGYREVVRIEARLNPQINGYFICDRGRYGFSYTNHSQRPRKAKILSSEVTVAEAIARAAENLVHIEEQSGSHAVACHGSARSSLETLAAAKHFCSQRRWNSPTFFCEQSEQNKVMAAAAMLKSTTAVTLRDIEQADLVLIVGADPLNEAPMLALAVRQSNRNGTPVTVLDPRPVSLPCAIDHIAAAPDELESCICMLIRETISAAATECLGPAVRSYLDRSAGISPIRDYLKSRVEGLTAQLKNSHRPVIICGTDVVTDGTPAILAALVELLGAAGIPAGLLYVLPGANSFAAALLSSADQTFMNTVESIENGSIRSLILVESDPFRFFPDRHRLEHALNALEFLLVMDYLPSPAARMAHIFLPTTTIFETGGMYINQSGILQSVPAHQGGGTPLEHISSGGTPPRVFRDEIPGAETQAAWSLLRAIADAEKPGRKTPTDTQIKNLIARQLPRLSGMDAPDPCCAGVRIPLNDFTNRACFAQALQRHQQPQVENRFEVVLTEHTFATEELSAYSECLRNRVPEPYAIMHPNDAAQLGINEHDRIALLLDAGQVEVTVQFAENIAVRTIVLPRHYAIAWQKMSHSPTSISAEQVVKIR